MLAYKPMVNTEDSIKGHAFNNIPSMHFISTL